MREQQGRKNPLCTPRPAPIVAAVITFLEGTLVEALPTHVVVGVQGVGYHVAIPLSSYDRLPLVGQQIKVLTHLQIREDAHVLFGFMSAAERDLFRLLVHHVSGIGPKTALDVLSGISVASFKAAVVANDVSTLSKTKGIGKKTAERIIVELKDKVGIAAAWEAASATHAPTPQETQINDAVLALISLGYKQVDAHKAVKQTLEKAAGPQSSEELVRAALKLLI
jgi:Holliday junction DNA helicase RuvA